MSEYTLSSSVTPSDTESTGKQLTGSVLLPLEILPQWEVSSETSVIRHWLSVSTTRHPTTMGGIQRKVSR